jgi:hypothetical protein
MNRALCKTVAIMTLVSAAPIWAHHGWSGYTEKLLTLTGTVEASSYANPHGSATLKTDDKTWTVVLAPPSRMQNRGLTREMLKPGVEAKVEGYAHRTDSSELRAERITIDGKTVELR